VRDQSLMRILMTEDEPVLADLIIEFLRDEGHDVSLVCDLERADQLLRATRWDAWVVDPPANSFAEPDRDCAATLRRLASVVPIVVTTGQLWARRTLPADLGVAAILNKPYDLNDLLQTLESVSTNR
jgi:DNA-binding response OmpR family regulator